MYNFGENQLTFSTEDLVLTDSETLEEALECLTENFVIDTQGACSQQTIFEILLKAASSGDSIENTTKTLKNVPTPNDIRYHLNKIKDFAQLEVQINQALRSRLPNGLQKGHFKMAIDLNLIPYYGEPSAAELPYIYRSEAKAGTCSFYAYATLYVLRKNKRVTLAIRGVRRLDTNVALVTYLLAHLESIQIKIKKLYLDKGFFSIAVIRWLQALDIPFIMPAIRRGKQGGINQFLRGRKSYKTTYTMVSNPDNSVTFELAIVGKYRRGKRQKHGVEYLVYVIYKSPTTLGYIRQDYRKRFGIESSYRLKNFCRIKTNNKNPAVRLFFVGLSFLLVNIWITLLWRHISQKRKGGRLIHRQLFVLKQMLGFISQAIVRKYQVVDAIYLTSS